MESILLKSIFLVIFHFLFFLTFFSYFKTILTKSHQVPKEFWLSTNQMDSLTSFSLPEEERKQLNEGILKEKGLEKIVFQTTFGGFLRICQKCQIIKPDRSHHCSVCKRCILKMDHHCPW